VKIITLSIGFTWDSLANKENEKNIVRLALDYAQREKVVVFAAASNKGNRAVRVTFPASERTLVICMNSSDGNGRPSRFNPPPQQQHGNFSILGEYVRSTWLQSADQNTVEYREENGAFKRSEGTSVATPIAASTAALILQLGRQYGAKRKTELESYKGIWEILLKMANEKKTKDGFFDIVPWNVLKGTLKTEKIKDIIDEAMQNV